MFVGGWCVRVCGLQAYFTLNPPARGFTISARNLPSGPSMLLHACNMTSAISSATYLSLARMHATPYAPFPWS